MPLRTLRRSLPALLVLGLATAAAGQTSYTATPDLGTRTWEVTGRLANPAEAPLELWFPRWTPGAYHLADYGRAVQGLEAADGDGAPLAVERVSDSLFRIAAQGEPVVHVRYRAASLAGDSFYSNGVIDVEANRIRDGYAFLNPPSLFGFAAHGLDEPFELRLVLPEGWRAASALERDAEGDFVAPSWYRFEDSPLLLSPSLRSERFEVDGTPHHVALHGADEQQAARIARACASIAGAASRLLGGLPYERYHFLIGLVPEGGGSGLEHSDSTLILLHPAMDMGSIQTIVAHELVHAWCGERIHVEALRRPDFTRPLRTGTIWFNESVTHYLTQHVLLEAGLLDREGFFAAVLGGMGHAPPEVSKRSLAAVSREATEGMNTIEGLMSFAAKLYGEGPRTVLALDLAMREASGGEHGIVDLVERLGDLYHEQGRGFPEDGLFEHVNALAGADLGEFRDRYVEGPEAPPLAEELAELGFVVEQGRVRSVPEPTPAQLAARAAFFGEEPARPAAVGN